jgi:predicted RNase H-like HicB family nuclease
MISWGEAGLSESDVPRHYTVSDGELVLFLWPAEEGGYNVTSPLDPALITQAETVEEAFEMARDAWELLSSVRAGGEPQRTPKTRKPRRAQSSSKGQRTVVEGSLIPGLVSRRDQ